MARRLFSLPLRLLTGHPYRCRRLLFLLFAIVVSAFLVLQLYAQPTRGAAALGCQDKRLWKCRSGIFGDTGKVRPLVKAGSTRFVSSIPNRAGSWVSGLNFWVRDVFRALAGQTGAPGAFWTWTYEDHADDLSMTSQQCQWAFPGLYDEIARAKTQYERFHITKDDLDKVKISEGRIRAGILDGQVGRTTLPPPSPFSSRPTPGSSFFFSPLSLSLSLSLCSYSDTTALGA